MDARFAKIFVGVFSVAFLALIATWVSVDLLSNLDELPGFAGSDGAGLGRVVFQHCSRVLRAGGGSLPGLFAVVSTAPAFVVARVAGRRTGSVA